MFRTSYVIAAALALCVALGIVFSSGIGTSTASAQTEPPAATPTASSTGLQSAFLDTLAAALGIERSALDSAITSAATTTVDDALAQGTLSTEQADALTARIAAGDIGALWGGHRGPGGPGGPGGGPGGPRVAGLHEAMLDAAAQALNITTADLQTQLRDGQTVAQLAEANGTTEQAVVDAALLAARTTLDEAVTAGTLTQEQADAAYTQLEAAGANILNRGGHGPRDRGTPPNAPAAPEATPEATTSA